ncbi:hypothetical protein SAMN06265350_106104 [Solitalea koreensis]|uniref:Uncharacterized protein n=1 Tax=Solitalea koreensis TaxID=543615 RepID=A0A521DA14_9SPHI|nr:hypothetical protein SAMN06265350_106104 [Solitalea koreensis]
MNPTKNKGDQVDRLYFLYIFKKNYLAGTKSAALA